MQIGFLKYIKKQEAFWKSNLVLDDHTAKVSFDLIVVVEPDIGMYIYVGKYIVGGRRRKL